MTLPRSSGFIVNAVCINESAWSKTKCGGQVTNVAAKQQTQNTGSRLQSPILLWLAKNSPKTHQRSPDSQKWDQLSDTVLTTEQNVIASTIFDHWEQNSPTNWLTQKYYRGHLLVLIKKTQNLSVWINDSNSWRLIRTTQQVASQAPSEKKMCFNTFVWSFSKAAFIPSNDPIYWWRPWFNFEKGCGCRYRPILADK